MKKLMMLSVAAVCLSACQTQRTESVYLDRLPVELQGVVEQELGEAQILGVHEGSFAGDWFYNVHYLDNGMQNNLRISEDGTVMSKSAWGGTFKEAAGAERRAW